LIILKVEMKAWWLEFDKKFPQNPLNENMKKEVADFTGRNPLLLSLFERTAPKDPPFESLLEKIRRTPDIERIIGQIQKFANDREKDYLVHPSTKERLGEYVLFGSLER
jgi:hypothetical protein